MTTTTRTDRCGSPIQTHESEQVPISEEQAARLEGVNNLLRYCEKCRHIWKWRGGPDPCPRCDAA